MVEPVLPNRTGMIRQLFLILFFFVMASQVMAFNELENSLNRFSAYNDIQKGMCYKNLPNAPCPQILKKIIDDDKQNAFLGALKSRYEICKKFAPEDKNISPMRLQSMMQSEYRDLGSYSNKTIQQCVGEAGITTDHVGKFYYYNRQLNKGATTLMRNQVVLSQILKKPAVMCPSELTLAKAAEACDDQKKCSSKNSIDTLATEADKDFKTYKTIFAEYKEQSKKCKSADCKPYVEKLGAILYQLQVKNPWFLNDAFMSSSNKFSTKVKLTQFFEKMYESQNELINEVALTANCVHGTSECTIKEMRETLEKMPTTAEPYGKYKLKNHLSQTMESQQCMEDASLDRDRTSKILTFAARDAALTVLTLGAGSVPMLVKLGLTGRALSTVRVGVEVLDISVNAYFAGAEWANTIKNCTDKEIKSLDGHNVNACNTETGLLFNQTTQHCALDATMAALATLPLGLNFLQKTKILGHAGDAAGAGSKLTPDVIKNAKLNDTARVAKFEKLMGVKPGTFANDPEKVAAILKAHNMPGTVGKLNFSQIRERVTFLKKQRTADGKRMFSDDEIRTGMDKGIFGNLWDDFDEGGRGLVKESKTIDAAVAGAVNNDLKNAKVIKEIKDTTWESGQSAYTGANNGGLEIMEKDGKKLFAKIKFPPADTTRYTDEQMVLLEKQFLNEVEYTKKLSDLGLGPKFHGVVKGNDGKYRVVTDFVDGYEVHLGGVDEIAGQVPTSVIQEISKKSKALLDAGIDPVDLQFRVTKDGKVFIVDPELFQPMKSAADKSFAAKMAAENIDDLRLQKNRSLLQKKQLSAGKGASQQPVKFSSADDFNLARAQGNITTPEKIATPPKGKTASYNYVLLEDGQMVLGKVDNEWQVGVNHIQLAQGKKVVGMGEMAVSDAGKVTYSVSSKAEVPGTLRSTDVDVPALEQKIGQYLQTKGKSGATAVEHSNVLTPTRKPFFGELMKYCSDAVFKARNSGLCSQLAQFSN